MGNSINKYCIVSSIPGLFAHPVVLYQHKLKPERWRVLYSHGVYHFVGRWVHIFRRHNQIMLQIDSEEFVIESTLII